MIRVVNLWLNNSLMNCFFNECLFFFRIKVEMEVKFKEVEEYKSCEVEEMRFEKVEILIKLDKEK